MNKRIRRALALVGRFTVRHPVLLLVLGALGAAPGVAWRLAAYGAAARNSDAFGYVIAASLGLLASCLLAPLFTGAMAPVAWRDAHPDAPRRGIVEAGFAAIARVLSLLIVSIVCTVAVLAGSLLALLPGLFVLAWVFTAPAIVMADGRGPIDALARSVVATRGRLMGDVGLIYAVAHVGSLLATYPLAIIVLIGFQDWLASMEMIQPPAVPAPVLHAWVDGVLLSFAHLPLAVLAATMHAYEDTSTSTSSRAETTAANMRSANTKVSE